MTTLQIDKAFLSPPEIAELLGVGHSKVLAWIMRGELRASDVATVRGQRPRYKVARADLDAFLARRSTTPEPETPRRRRKKADDQVIQFYT